MTSSVLCRCLCFACSCSPHRHCAQCTNIHVSSHNHPEQRLPLMVTIALCRTCACRARCPRPEQHWTDTPFAWHLQVMPPVGPTALRVSMHDCIMGVSMDWRACHSTCRDSIESNHITPNCERVLTHNAKPGSTTQILDVIQSWLGLLRMGADHCLIQKRTVSMVD